METWGTQALQFLSFVILSRLLDPESFGLVAMATVYIAFIRVFIDQGFGAAVVQRANLSPEHLDTAFWTAVTMGLLLLLASIAGADLVARLFRDHRLSPVIAVLSPNFALSALSTTQTAILRRKLDFRGLAVRSLSAEAAAGVVGIGVALAGYGVWSLVSHSLARGLVGAIVLWRVSDWRPRFRVSKDHFRDLFAFGLGIVGFDILNFVTRRMDDFLVGRFLGAELLGYYSLAYRALLIMTGLLIGMINSVAFPAFSRLQADNDHMRQAFYRAAQMASLLALPIFAGTVAVAPELVRAVYGAKWAPSAAVLQVLALIGLLYPTLYLADAVILAAGKPTWRLMLGGLSATLNAAAFLAVVRWGIVAVAAGYVAVGYLLSPLYLWALRSLIRLELRSFLRALSGPALGTVTMTVAVCSARQLLAGSLSPPVLLALLVLFGALTYFLAIGYRDRALARSALELARVAMPFGGSHKRRA